MRQVAGYDIGPVSVARDDVARTHAVRGDRARKLVSLEDGLLSCWHCEHCKVKY